MRQISDWHGGAIRCAYDLLSEGSGFARDLCFVGGVSSAINIYKCIFGRTFTKTNTRT